MHVFTELLTKQWDLTNVRFIRSLGAKGQRQVLQFESREGQWVLKVLAPFAEESRVRKYTLALAFIEQCGLAMAPCIRRTFDQKMYVQHEERFMYLMEYIDGRPLREEPDDEYCLGQATGRLHQVKGYLDPTCLDIDEELGKIRGRFADRPFKREYDAIVQSLPDFTKLRQSFIHTDVGPHNALFNREGHVVCVDWDDAGMGPACIDAGYPLICQFVRYQPNEVLGFDRENAKAFYQGYFSVNAMEARERSELFDGAVFMQLMYMSAYGPQGVDRMWGILKYALDHKDQLLQTFM